MNYWFISAGALLFVSLLVHMIAGDKEYRRLRPGGRDAGSGKVFGYWLMGRGTFQMVSVDLLLTGAAVSLTGVGVIPYNFHLMLFIASLCAGYLFAWLLTLVISKAGPSNYLGQGQWMLFLITLALIVVGMC